MKDRKMIDLPAPAFTAENVAMMQVGPNPSTRNQSPLPIPRRRTVIEPPAAADTAPAADAKKPGRFEECVAAGRANPAAGIALAKAWLAENPTPEARVAAQLCLGQLQSAQGDYAGAEQAFVDAAANIPADHAAAAIPLYGMAGNAALAAGQAERATDWFDKALAIKGATDNVALGGLQADRARALVAQGRMAEAGGALDEAHRLAPDDPQGWLLSATLARRGKDLPRAQRDIEIASNLDPRDPAIGLEAGVIAVLDGRDEAARKSWESVVKAAPASEEAKVAKGYLEQLGPAPTSSASTPPAQSIPPAKQVP
ncbi:MAG: hypothetical protein B7Z34_04250 [Novosphingobium sp. 12-62-10]|nr:MAG: hypothetical protein B7Z34_04250 [Novosphingobium sp. 12-62-10]